MQFEHNCNPAVSIHQWCYVIPKLQVYLPCNGMLRGFDVFPTIPDRGRDSAILPHQNYALPIICEAMEPDKIAVPLVERLAFVSNTRIRNSNNSSICVSDENNRRLRIGF